jgi:hypothetical protein
MSKQQRSQKLHRQREKALRLAHESNVAEDNLSSRLSPIVRTVPAVNGDQRTPRQRSQTQRREREAQRRIRLDILRRVSIITQCVLTSVLTTSSATSSSTAALQRPDTATRPGPDGRHLSFLWCIPLGSREGRKLTGSEAGIHFMLPTRARFPASTPASTSLPPPYY